jgi:hypothetical protein
MNDTLKEKIKKVVLDYKKLFPQEYDDVKEVVKQKRNLKANPFGATLKDSALGRHILEMPETLHAIFNLRLDDEEMKVFNLKDSKRWFAKEFKEFSVAEKI